MNVDLLGQYLVNENISSETKSCKQLVFLISKPDNEKFHSVTSFSYLGGRKFI